MRQSLFKDFNLFQPRPIKVVLLYLAMTLIWIFEAPTLTGLFVSHIHLRAGVIDTLVNGTFLLVTAIMIFLLFRRQLTLHTDSQNQYEMLFHSNPTPMWIFEKKSLRFLQVNNTATCIYGYSAEEFKRMSMLDITSPDDRDKIVLGVKNMFYNYNPSANYEHVKKNGELFTAKITSHKIYFQNRDCIMVMAEDVTLQDVQDKALKLLCDAEKEYKEELEANIKQLTATLQEKQRLADVILDQNAVLKKLAWTNSHIVRKPIASIISLVELAESATSMEEIKELNSFIGVCSKELDSITKEVSQEINNRNLDGFMEV
jgi:PAS domain S-box-containing protein